MAKLELTAGGVTATATATNAKADEIIRAFLRAAAGRGQERLDRKVREWAGLPARVEESSDPFLALGDMTAQQLASAYVEEIVTYTVARAHQSESERIGETKEAERTAELAALGLGWE